MKIMVVYQSKTGFTQKYATWIAQALSCEAKELKGVSSAEIASYDIVIFGGWIMGGNISGLNKIRSMNPRKLIVFAVGSSPDCEEQRNQLKKQNSLKEMPFFYFQGGLCLEKLGFFSKMMVKMANNALRKKENKTQQEEELVKLFDAGSYDCSDIGVIEPLVAFVKERENEN